MKRLFQRLINWFLIPQGPYCYKTLGPLYDEDHKPIGLRTRVCPYWRTSETEQDGTVFSQCTRFLKTKMNFADEVLIMDQCKICGTKDSF